MEQSRNGQLRGLILLMLAYTFAEATAFLTGLRVLPYSPWAQPIAVGLSAALGVRIETGLVLLSGKRMDPLAIPWAFGLFYMVPVIAGFAGRFVGHLIPFSAVLFVVLVVVIGMRLSARARADV